MSFIKSGCYYRGCGTTAGLRDVMSDHLKEQGEAFPVMLRFGYVDKSQGCTKVRSGCVYGVLDGGDKLFIYARTADAISCDDKTNDLDQSKEFFKCGWTNSMQKALSDIFDRRGTSFPVRATFSYLDGDGVVQQETGLVTGALDNGDEVYIDAETRDYRARREMSKQGRPLL